MAGRQAILGGLLAGLMLILGLAQTAQAATISKPGFTATVTAAVAPTHLPRSGAGPVTLTITGSSNRSEGASTVLRSFSVGLDRQLSLDTEGLPTCPFSVQALGGYRPDYVQRKCGAAQVGTGTMNWTIGFPEAPPQPGPPFRMLFLNLQSGGIAMYRYNPAHPVHFEDGTTETVPAALAGTFSVWTGGTTLSFANPEAVPSIPTATSRFRIRLGRTWHYKGRRHSLISGECRTGTLRNKVTLMLRGGTVSDAAPERCTGS
jgi:hypothetical protein